MNLAPLQEENNGAKPDSELFVQKTRTAWQSVPTCRLKCAKRAAYADFFLAGRFARIVWVV